MPFLRSIVALAILGLVPACQDFSVVQTPEKEGDDAGECSDDADNDADGLFDCDDPDCGASDLCIDQDEDGWTVGEGDCVDQDPDIYPGAPELCDDLDNDCDGDVDEDLEFLDWFEDADGDGYGDADSVINDCIQPADHVADDTDCDDTLAEVNPGEEESTCNGLDDDCDPATEDTPDGDGDGAPECDDCDDTDPELNLDDLDGDGYSTCQEDCDDADDAVNPGMTEEHCNDIDDDCDPATEDVVDADGDGHDVCVDCDDADADLHLDDADGDGWTPCDGDCDDGDALVSPDATELLCNGVDDDCDPVTEDAPDHDNDGTSWCDDCDDADPTLELNDVDGDGVTTCDGDCDDGDAASYPGALEVCDGADNDCDGTVDEGFLFYDWYPDSDGDTYGNYAVIPTSACYQPPGFVQDHGDCDDTNAAVNPGEAETICDGLDNDCDAATEDEPDEDADGWDACVDCDDHDELANLDDEDGDGWTTCDGDCNDLSAVMNLDDVDGDGYATCDGDCDDTDPVLNLDDADSDGSTSCEGDCDDFEPSAYAGAPELCDGIDNNCDGTVELFIEEDFDSDISSLVASGDYILEGDAAQVMINPAAGSLYPTDLGTDQRGSFFLGTAYTFDSFELHVSFNLGDFSESEGVTVVLADENTASFLGCWGEYLGFGYAGGSASCSGVGAGVEGLAVEIDTSADASVGDPDGNHVAVVDTFMGVLDEASPVDDLNDQQWREIALYFEGGLLDVYVDNQPLMLGVEPGYAQFVGYLGVTGATSADYQYQILDNLQICSFD